MSACRSWASTWLLCPFAGFAKHPPRRNGALRELPMYGVLGSSATSRRKVSKKSKKGRAPTQNSSGVGTNVGLHALTCVAREGQTRRERERKAQQPPMYGR